MAAHEACGILLPRSGIKPMPFSLEVWRLIAGPPGTSQMTIWKSAMEEIHVAYRDTVMYWWQASHQEKLNRAQKSIEWQYKGWKKESVNRNSTTMKISLKNKMLFKSKTFSSKQKLGEFITIIFARERSNSGWSQVRPDGNQNPREGIKNPETSLQLFISGGRHPSAYSNNSLSAWNRFIQKAKTTGMLMINY